MSTKHQKALVLSSYNDGESLIFIDGVLFEGKVLTVLGYDDELASEFPDNPWTHWWRGEYDPYSGATEGVFDPPDSMTDEQWNGLRWEWAT